LQATGGKVFPVIPAHVTLELTYGHIIQSKQPPFGPIIDHANVPLFITEIVIKVELVSPLKRHPELPKRPGFVEGLEILPEVKSTMLVAVLLGAIPNEGVVQPGTASTQSFG
jgi:hypothetical protein